VVIQFSGSALAYRIRFIY